MRKKTWRTAAPSTGSQESEAIMHLVLAKLLQRELMRTEMLEGGFVSEPFEALI